ncbi:glycerophosphodiester phosphodiesterase [Brevundimonas sp. LM2]|uniref:glycerophosphodiester phosphodiesterase family protein n=1 Tax=Brevundimonas sp. LM2 TaxID=1938605 RepID=UPI000983F4FA|nr:glycerophosphodiester phosphodiesterase family protein [Brevundimonas sp. LM2]AQR61806.1 glycerophosphodiester phosphodiesterase [Brevundimonas sp. LM2]
MTRLSLATLLLASTVAGCAGGPPVTAGSTPRLAAYFDCVRETGGIAISAHRAQSGEDQPENSIQAIEATGRAIPGAIVEIDAALTRDGVLVLMHDDSLDRTTTGRGLVADNTLAQIQAADLRAPDGTVSDAAPPTLAEALAAAGRVGAIASLDLKPSSEAATVALARRVVDEVRRARAADRVILITYSAEAARAVAAMAPEMMISAGLDDVAGLDGLNAPQILAWTGTREARPALWRALGDRGVEVQFGTLGGSPRALDRVYAADGDVSEYRALFEQGAVVIATDTPLAVKGVLGVELVAAQRCPR